MPSSSFAGRISLSIPVAWFLARDLRTSQKATPAAIAQPAMGPITAPAIQDLLPEFSDPCVSVLDPAASSLVAVGLAIVDVAPLPDVAVVVVAVSTLGAIG